MPYEIKKTDKCPASKPWAVIKSETGEVLGCCATKEDAEAMQAAIGANTHGAMMDELRERAARERAQNMATRADRPHQRRSAEHVTGGRARILVPASITLRAAGADGGRLHFHGLASAYESGYEMWDAFGPYTEIVSAGAGSASLARTDLDVPLVLGHDQLRRMARTTNGTLTLTETDAGLDVDAPDLDPADHDVAYIAPKINAGLIDEMSFAFMITNGQWSPDYTEYRINSYDIHRGDVAIVGYGANPATEATLRQRAAAPSSRARALLELAIAR